MGQVRESSRFVDEIMPKRFADIDEWQTQMQLKSMAIGRIQLFSTGLTPAQHAVTKLPVGTLKVNNIFGETRGG